MNVLDLTPAHVGRTVTIRHLPAGTGPDWTISGPLTGITSEQDEILEQTLSDAEPTVAYGRATVQVSIGPFAATIHDPSHTVVYLGGAR